MADTAFTWMRLRSPAADWLALREDLEGGMRARLAEHDVRIWGIWFGLFGIASNELVMVTWGAADGHAAAVDAALSPLTATVVEREQLVATVRPQAPRALDRAGLYVFRLFDVDTRHVDEIAQLSKTAWETFENTDAYRAEPQGLFAPLDRSVGRSRMLLLTWYDGFDSWVASRRPPPEARENFVRRRELTHGTIAYATRLVAHP